MSFAAQTKKELTQVQVARCCQLAELEAILALNGCVREVDGATVLDVETENVATARRIYTNLKEALGVQPEVVVRRKMRLKKNNVYGVRVSGTQVEKVMAAFPAAATIAEGRLAFHLPLRRKSCCRRAWLRGAFLAAGSVNDPGSHSYHLEISAGSPELAAYLQQLMNRYDLRAKVIQRKRGHVVYLKEGEKIVEFLRVIGAHQALLRFEDVRILKGMRNQVNRLVNCETANLNKTIGAAVRQLEVIRYLDRRIGLNNLPPHLREAAELRLRYPEVNLQELTARLGHRVSKSGLNHRFRKLEEIAEKLRNEAR